MEFWFTSLWNDPDSQTMNEAVGPKTFKWKIEQDIRLLTEIMKEGKDSAGMIMIRNTLVNETGLPATITVNTLKARFTKLKDLHKKDQLDSLFASGNDEQRKTRRALIEAVMLVTEREEQSLITSTKTNSAKKRAAESNTTAIPPTLDRSVEGDGQMTTVLQQTLSFVPGQMSRPSARSTAVHVAAGKTDHVRRAQPAQAPLSSYGPSAPMSASAPAPSPQKKFKSNSKPTPGDGSGQSPAGSVSGRPTAPVKNAPSASTCSNPGSTTQNVAKKATPDAEAKGNERLQKVIWKCEDLRKRRLKLKLRIQAEMERLKKDFDSKYSSLFAYEKREGEKIDEEEEEFFSQSLK